MSLLEEGELDELRAEWVGRQFDEKEFEVSVEKARLWAQACGETRAEFCDPEHENFQVSPTFTSHFTGRKAFPKELSALFSRGMPFDAGKLVESHAPIRPGEKLIGRSQVHDIYEKSGRSGSMLFIVHRMTFTNPQDELKSIVDWRMVVREKPSESKES